MNWKKLGKGFVIFWIASFIVAMIIGIITGLLVVFTGINIRGDVWSSNLLNLISATIGLIVAYFYTKEKKEKLIKGKEQ